MTWAMAASVLPVGITAAGNSSGVRCLRKKDNFCNDVDVGFHDVDA